MAHEAATSRRWPDLPPELLREISSHLHDAADYVRFHAVCKPWRDTLPPAPCRPAFLPWLLTPRCAVGHQTARCVLSSPRSSSSRSPGAAEIRLPDRRWVVRAHDGTAGACLRSASSPGSGGLVDPLTGSAADTLPHFPDDGDILRWVEGAAGNVSSDGTFFLYAILCSSFHSAIFTAAILRPGDAAWTLLESHLSFYLYGRDDYCAAYLNGTIVLCWNSRCWFISSTKAYAGVPELNYWTQRDKEKDVESNYLVESRGELLWVLVRAVNTRSLPPLLSLSVYVPHEGEGDKLRRVKKDGQSLADRVLFLGRLSCFAMDAARFGMSGGCAYFLDKRQLCDEEWSRCRLFRYSFHGDKCEFVNQLPEYWNTEAGLWLTPQPAINQTEEITEKLHAVYRKVVGSRSYFRICVGNLSRKVDSDRLRHFFQKHGKVADARVVVDRKTGRSRTTRICSARGELHPLHPPFFFGAKIRVADSVDEVGERLTRKHVQRGAKSSARE